METGWIVESDSQYVYVNDTTYGSARLGFTGDNLKALRFARKEDAEAIVKLLPAFGLTLPENAIGVNEHEWEDAAEGRARRREEKQRAFLAHQIQQMPEDSLTRAALTQIIDRVDEIDAELRGADLDNASARTTTSPPLLHPDKSGGFRAGGVR